MAESLCRADFGKKVEPQSPKTNLRAQASRPCLRLAGVNMRAAMSDC